VPMQSKAGHDPIVTPELLRRYDRPGPRYTSYPTVPAWREDFGDPAYRAALARAREQAGEPLSLYIHIPFCVERCAFCGCNVIITRQEGVADRYLDYVDKELAMAAEALGPRRGVAQMHWGGGTPTHLSTAQMARLLGAVRAHFDVAPDAELAIEVDPRVTTREQLAYLRGEGFNRISMGVQDLDPDVQCEIHRNQTEADTRQMHRWCRELEFHSVNMDLVYGLPGQQPVRWHETLRKIVEMAPDRLAVYSYAYLPERLRNQKRIDPARLPMGHAKYELLAAARETFTASGYWAIGMDHFALPGDELAVASRERRLYRNFMGYTVTYAPDMLGFGTSAIGEVGGAFAQNEKKLSRYYRALDAGEFATMSGCVLSEDDRIRAWVIRQITCNFYLDFAELQGKFGVDFDAYFAGEAPEIAALEADGFLVREPGALRLLPLGHVFVRNVAMVFDAYLPATTAKAGFSRTV